MAVWLRISLGLVLTASTAAAEIPTDVDPWYRGLCGVWQAQLDDHRTLYESWSFNADGELQGQGWLERDGRRQVHERLRLWQLNGTSRYSATPTGQATVDFIAVVENDPAARRWVNARNDFPQVIRYRLELDRLEAQITNLDDEQLQAGQRWRFQRLRDCQANTEEH